MSEFLGQRADGVSLAKSSARRSGLVLFKDTTTHFSWFPASLLRKAYVLPLPDIDPQVDEEMYMCSVRVWLGYIGI
jgi:hypothetical protein